MPFCHLIAGIGLIAFKFLQSAIGFTSSTEPNNPGQKRLDACNDCPFSQWPIWWTNGHFRGSFHAFLRDFRM